MSIVRACRPVAFGAALFAFSAAAAHAAPAYVKSTVNLRAGPGTDQSILGKIPAGSLIDASNCDGGWCAVDWQGKSGYAIATALDTSGRVPAARRVARAAPPQAHYDDDDIDIPAGPTVVVGAPAIYGYPYPYYRPFGYYRTRPYYGYRHGGWRGGYRRW